MDELDASIIEILQEDGRTPNAEIARHVGVSEGTVRRRLKRLVEKHYVEIVALPNPSIMGYESEALIGIHVDPDKIDQVSDSISELDEVRWVTVVTGSYDIFAWAALLSSEALGNFLRTKVGTIPGVRRTETFVNLAAKRRGHGIVI